MMQTKINLKKPLMVKFLLYNLEPRATDMNHERKSVLCVCKTTLCHVANTSLNL